MTSASSNSFSLLAYTGSSSEFVICPGAQLDIEGIEVEVKEHQGQFADVHYFKAKFFRQDVVLSEFGLLRVGTIDGGLKRELEFRKALGNYGLVSQLLTYATKEAVRVSLKIPNADVETASEAEFSVELKKQTTFNPEVVLESTSIDDSKEEAESYLEEMILDDSFRVDIPSQKLILLSELPPHEQSLEAWIHKEHSLEESLLLVSQICQFFRYAHQHNWCFVQIFPQYIQQGSPIKFFDLTGAYPINYSFPSGVLGDYCPPELAYETPPLTESVSTYIVGALLYQSIHNQLPTRTSFTLPDIKPTPYIYQILKICLSLPEDRFPLAQLLSLLLEVRQSLQKRSIRWETAGRSTVGLSTKRLHNEDHYGVCQKTIGDFESILIGVVADGMGGLAQGELASELAVNTILEVTIPTQLATDDQKSQWLQSLFQKVNEAVAAQTHEGGTTLSLVFVVGCELFIAHVGDSRIFLLRDGQICQLSEDHSLVAMQLANSQITYEESLNHPDKNILTRSIGGGQRLSEGYVQELSRFGIGISMPLEDNDILLLCSDGVWDLVHATEMCEIFVQASTLQEGIDETVTRVLARGAHDNATILALKCAIATNP